MRLLNTGTLEIEEVFDDAVPPYAILSHTWGQDEVTFQDLRKLNSDPHENNYIACINGIQSKAGFTKVKKTAEEAKRRGLGYLWIDTCCIDKTSSAELSEAINSMYRWYQESQECYAYLFDVGEKLQDPERVAENFTESRWFTRGWTLQELVAPQVVRFYNGKWDYLGSKDSGTGTKSMALLLSRITGIDRGVLSGHMVPTDLSVASRMQWVTDRRTTRTEDLAYCLIGIFDVNMPLLYGEGQKAFTRLQEEILRATDDQSLFAWATDPRMVTAQSADDICGLLAPHPRFFKHVRSMNPLPPLMGRESVPSSFTNQGLRVQLQLKPVAKVAGINSIEVLPEEYIAVLDCSVTSGVSHFWPALHLRRLWDDQFARIRPGICRYLPPSAVAGSEYKTVYVKQKPKHVIPELFVPTEGDEEQNDEQFMDLQDFHPPGRWNPHSMTLRSVYSSSSGVTGAFRFRQHKSSGEEVDVIVGIRPSLSQIQVRQANWEAWCFQRRANGRPLCEVFDYWDKTLRSSLTIRPSLVEYQSLFGEDRRLLSAVAVEETMMYGRVFFKVKAYKRAELDVNAILEPSDASLFSNDDALTLSGPGLEKIIATVTAKNLAASYFVEEHERNEKAVRTHERYNSNWLVLVTGLKAHPSMGADPSKKRGSESWVRFTRNLASSAINIEAWNTKLLEACRRGDAERAKELLRRGANPNCCTRYNNTNPWGFSIEGMTPIHWAVITKSEAIISDLIHEGANIMAESTERWNILHFLALRYSTGESLPKALAEKLAALDEDSLMKMGRTKVTDMLESPLHIVAGRPDGIAELFDLLAKDELGLRGDRNQLGEMPLHRAAASGNMRAVEYLVQAWATGEVGNLYQLDKQDDELRTPVWHAAGAGSVEALALLLNAGANPNLADRHGRTPLHVACREGQAAAVEVLLQHGAYHDSPTDFISLTPYHFAVLFQHERCLQLLLEISSLDVRVLNKPTDNGCSFSPLHLAASNGWLAGTEMLVAAGANINQKCEYLLALRSRAQEGRNNRDTDDSSPFLVEVSAGNVHELVALLLEREKDSIFIEKLEKVQEFLNTAIAKNNSTRANTTSSLSSAGLSQPIDLVTRSAEGMEEEITRSGRFTENTPATTSPHKDRQPLKPKEPQQKQNRCDNVVDLSSYDGGTALEIPTPGLNLESKTLRFHSFPEALHGGKGSNSNLFE